MATIGWAWSTRPAASSERPPTATASVIEFARANPENYDCEFVDSFLDLIVKLEASAVEAQRAVNNVDRSG